MALTLLLAAMTAQLTSMELLSVIKKLVNVLVHLASSLIWTGLQIVDICRQMMAVENDFYIGCQVNFSSTLHIVHNLLMSVIFKFSLRVNHKLYFIIGRVIWAISGIVVFSTRQISLEFFPTRILNCKWHQNSICLKYAMWFKKKRI